MSKSQEDSITPDTAQVDFGERFDALVVEAQAAKDTAVSKVRALLAEADAILDDLRARGVSVRTELALGVDTKLVHMYFQSSFYQRLK